MQCFWRPRCFHISLLIIYFWVKYTLCLDNYHFPFSPLSLWTGYQSLIADQCDWMWSLCYTSRFPWNSIINLSAAHSFLNEEDRVRICFFIWWTPLTVVSFSFPLSQPHPATHHREIAWKCQPIPFLSTVKSRLSGKQFDLIRITAGGLSFSDLSAGSEHVCTMLASVGNQFGLQSLLQIWWQLNIWLKCRLAARETSHFKAPQFLCWKVSSLYF